MAALRVRINVASILYASSSRNRLSGSINPGSTIVLDEEFLAVKFGAAVDERRDAVGDQIAAEIVIVEDAPDRSAAWHDSW
jgi:hypothetical protein